MLNTNDVTSHKEHRSLICVRNVTNQLQILFSPVIAKLAPNSSTSYEFKGYVDCRGYFFF